MRNGDPDQCDGNLSGIFDPGTPMMGDQNPITEERILAILDRVKDPEIPVISLIDLGVVNGIDVSASGAVTVTITPTYTGCPAMDVMKADILTELGNAGIEDVRVELVLAPAWSTDRITEGGKRKLKEYGIAPPETTADIRALKGKAPIVECPQCGSEDTVMLSAFGSTACKALWKCNTCLEPFDQFKCL